MNNTAIMLVQTGVRHQKDVCDAILGGVPGVERIDATIGPYDLVVRTIVPRYESPQNTELAVRNIPGVERVLVCRVVD